VPDTVITTEALSKNYGRRPGIVDVSLEVYAGEVFGYLGPNGAGKTTTIRVLLDLIRANGGSARVFGLDSRRHSVDIRRRSGFLPGELNLYENMTCGDLLRFFAGLRGGVDWLYVEELASRLNCHLSQPIHSLSQGNKRKIGLIQAFMYRPELLILDEPTSGLDPLVRHEFYYMVAEAKERGQTIFFSSHNLPEVERICDRVAIIRNGRLAAMENVADLKSRSLRDVEIHFGEDVDPGAFSNLAGLQVIEADKRLLKFQVKGGIDLLLKTAARFKVVDLISREPGLEDVFMAFYGSNDHAF
jgi:ABC-2 type transport system ATP-binding protein